MNMRQIISLCYFLIVLCNHCSPLRLNFLKVVERFNSSTYDFYYHCNTCSSVLQWRINNQSAGTHDSQSPVSEVVSSRDSSGTGLRYSSVLLSSILELNQQSCLDAVLIVTRTCFQQLHVSCRGETEQQFLYSPSTLQQVNRSTEAGAVRLEYVLSLTRIRQSSPAHFTTYIFVCSTSETQSWNVNGLSAGTFNGPNEVGDILPQEFSNYPSDLNRRTILEAKSSSNLTSVLIVSTVNITMRLSVRCMGLEDTVGFNISAHPKGWDTLDNQTNETTHSTTASPVYYSTNIETVSTGHEASKIYIRWLLTCTVIFYLGL